MNQTEQNTLSFERVVFFSDAVFAIVITLLVLEIKVPHIKEINDEAIIHSLIELIPKFIGFIFSFFIIGIMWIEHHRIFRYIQDFNIGLLFRNMVFLLCISFIPFPTALLSEYFWSKTAFILYALIFALAGLTKLWIWNYAVKTNLVSDEIEPSQVKNISRRSLAVPLCCTFCIVLALFLPNFFSFIGFPLIPLFAKLLNSAQKDKVSDKNVEVDEI